MDEASPTRGSRRQSVAIAIAAAAVIAVAITAAALTRPRWMLPSNAALLETSQAITGLAALAATWIALLRAKRTLSTNDLALAVAIGVLSLTSMVLVVLTLRSPLAPSASSTWLAVPGRLVTGALLLAASGSGRSLARLPTRLGLLLLIAALTSALAWCGALVGTLDAGASVPVGIQLVTISIYVAAAATLLRRARRERDGVLGWYAAAAGGLAVSRVVAVLLPAPASHWIYAGDLLRVAVAALLLMAVRAELLRHRGRALETAIAEERRRLAREIHDGLAQELAFIVSQSQYLISRPPDPQALASLAAAGQTALTDARRAIFDLKRPKARALSTAIVERTYVIADRAGLALDVEVVDDVSVSPQIEHAIVRIANEAVSNAARHADASTIAIRISCEDERVMVRITDDGSGFDAHVLNPRRGFGLRSMSQRAESLGGSLHLESEPGTGTVIEVAI